MFGHWHTSELREGRLEVIEFKRIWPVILVRCSQNFKNLEDLINLRISHEERSTLDHLSEDAASGPSVYSKRVCLLTEKDFRASIPECDDLVGVSLDRKAKCAGQSKISKLNVDSSSIDEQVLRFQVTMEDSVLVQVD